MDSDSKIETIFGIPVKTLSLIILLAFISVGLIIIAVKQINQKPVVENNTINSINTVSPQTILSISPNPVLVSTPSASYYKTDVLINTGDNKVNSVQLELSFDPEILTNIDIIPGRFFQNSVILLKNIDQQNGRISYAITSNQQFENGVSGKSIIATIIFSLSATQKTATSTAITFLPKTEVAANGSAESVLKSYEGGEFLLTPIKMLFPSPTEQVGNVSAH